jgi:hypothetical protein
MKNTFNYTKEQVIDFNKAVVLFQVLNDKNDLIDKTKLRVLAFQGIPNLKETSGDDLRSIVWRVLMEVLPLQPSKWNE